MTTDPTPPAADPADLYPVTAFAAANRSLLAAALIAVGVVGFAGMAYSFGKLFRPPAAAADKGKADAPAVDIADPNRFEHVGGGLVGLAVAAVGLGVGVVRLVGLPPATDGGRLAEARATLLLAGGGLGLALMAGGAYFFVLYFGSLTAWLDAGEAAQARWVLGPLLAFLVGAAVAFAAAQPARADERDNPALRRLVYGANVGLSAVLLLVLLVVGNVFAALRVPNRLDTTAGGFYSLADPTKELLAGLDQPVTAYSTVFAMADPESDRLARDVRALLEACYAVNPARFRYRPLDPSLNADEIKRLAQKYPAFDRNELGVLLTAGDDDGRAGYIRADEMFDREFAGRGPSAFVFKGEGRLVRELLFLAENRTKPVVYFTQASGELEVVPAAAGGGPAGRARAGRTARQLRDALEKGNAVVKALEPDAAAPKVPDDAAVVVVADPVAPLPPDQVSAIAAYMSAPRADGKKGKLIVLTGPHPSPADRRAVAATGLEGLLAGFGVRVEPQALFAQRVEPLGYADLPVGVSADLADARNPVALAFADRILVMPGCREVAAADGGRADPLLITLPGRLTWTDPDPTADPARTWADFATQPDLRAARLLSRRPRAVAALVSDPPDPAAKGAAAVGRLAVYGSGAFFADPAADAGRSAGVPAELFATTVDWLRDRPAAANIANKTYGVYAPKPDLSYARALVLPVGATLLGVMAAGFGVWVFRRT